MPQFVAVWPQASSCCLSLYDSSNSSNIPAVCFTGVRLNAINGNIAINHNIAIGHNIVIFVFSDTILLPETMHVHRPGSIVLPKEDKKLASMISSVLVGRDRRTASIAVTLKAAAEKMRQD